MIERENRNQFRNVKRAGSLLVAVLCLLIPLASKAADNDAETQRIKESGDVLKELINGNPGIPQNLLNKSECVIVLPSVKKAGFIVGGQYGRGLMTCRSGENFKGKWSAPIMMQSSGGSLGLQIGGEATDFVVLVMNDKGAKAVMHGKAKLGGDASVAAGPVGRDAEASTDATMSAEMLSYSRAHGVFGGVSLSGTSLGPDSDANEKVYGKKISGGDFRRKRSGSSTSNTTAFDASGKIAIERFWWKLSSALERMGDIRDDTPPYRAFNKLDLCRGRSRTIRWGDTTRRGQGRPLGERRIE